jgi:hypothetical protein
VYYVAFFLLLFALFLGGLVTFIQQSTHSFIRATSVACAVGPSVVTCSTDFSFEHLVFWNLFEFSAEEIT